MSLPPDLQAAPKRLTQLLAENLTEWAFVQVEDHSFTIETPWPVAQWLRNEIEKSVTYYGGPCEITYRSAIERR